MTFDADAAAAEVAADFPPFTFTWRDEEFELPNVAMLTTNEALELQTAMTAASANDEGSTDAVFDMVGILDRVAGEEVAGALRDMPAAVMARIMVAWQDAGEEAMEDLGKAASEPSPRNREERRSKQTSRPKAKTSTTSSSTKSAATSAA